MLVSLSNLDIITAVDGVVVCAFGGILFNFLYRNRSSNYVTKPCRKYYNRPINELGI
jgi:hypothetical protein